MNRLAKVIAIMLMAPLPAAAAAMARPDGSAGAEARLAYAAEDSEEAAKKDAQQAREADWYEKGSEALDDGQWDAAVKAFSKAAGLAGRRADGAIYWKAYALRKLTRLTEALSALETLRTTYPQSRWLDDAKALEVEIHGASGRPVSPDAEDDEELKLVALNGLINMDSDRAVPMLEKFLQGTASRRLKEQALFVLVQTGSPRARETVVQIARGRSNPDLQAKALEYLALFGGGETKGLLKEIYESTSDAGVKRSILEGYMASGETEPLYAAARRESDPALRRKAIELLGAQGAQEELVELYKSESSLENKEQILQALAISGDVAKLAELARGEKEPRLRRSAIQGLGLTDPDESGSLLISLYASEKETDVRRAVLDALFVQGNDRALIDIARKEKDPQLRKDAVEKLSNMDSKEATEFLLEILNKE